LFAGLACKPLIVPNPVQESVWELIEREGPMNIEYLKETLQLRVKDITPALHRLQEAFLVYEDQYDGEWDRGWYKFAEMFPDVDVEQYSRHESLIIVLQRFAYRHVVFDSKMAKSFYKLPEKEIKSAIATMIENNTIFETEHGYMLPDDVKLLETYAEMPKKRVFAMHRNDFMVKSNEHWLKTMFTHDYPDTLYYILVDGVFCGAVVGKFRYTPEVEDVIVDLPQDEAAARKDELLQAVQALCGIMSRRYLGEVL